MHIAELCLAGMKHSKKQEALHYLVEPKMLEGSSYVLVSSIAETLLRKPSTPDPTFRV